MKIRVLIAFLMLNIPFCVMTAQDHDADPLPLSEILDSVKVKMTFDNFEQGIKAHDFNIGNYTFDSLVTISGTLYTKDSLINSIRQFFTYMNLDTSLLTQEYNSKPNDFYPLFNVTEIYSPTLWSSGNIAPIGSRHNLTFKVQTSPHLSPVICSLTIKKTQHSLMVPSLDYVIDASDGNLLEAIQNYAHDYIVYTFGTTGEINFNWDDWWWHLNWNFRDDEPKQCEHIINQFHYTNKALISVPIKILLKNYNVINRSVAKSLLNGNILIGAIRDFQPLHINGENIMQVNDWVFNRYLTANLSNLSLKACPDGSNGYQFGWLSNSIAMASGKVAIIDLASIRGYGEPDKYLLFDYISSNPNAIVHTYSSPDIPNNFSVGAMAFDEGKMFPGHNILFSSIVNNTVQIRAYPRDNIQWTSPVGFITQYSRQCPNNGGFVEWMNFKNINNLYLHDKPDSKSSYNTLGVVEYFDGSSKFILLPGQCPGCSGGPIGLSTNYITTIPKSDDGTITLINSIDRDGDGSYLLTDANRGVVHKFDFFNGEYLCTMKDPEGNTFQLLLGMKNASYAGSSNVKFNDLYCAENWDDIHGFRRFYPGADVVNVVRKEPDNSGTKPTVIIWTATNSCKFEMYVGNPQGNFPTRRGERPAGRYRDEIRHAYGNIISIVVTPLRNNDYGQYQVQPYTIIINPDGSVIKKENRLLAVKPNASTLEQNYPNPFNPSTTIIYNLSNPSHVYLDVCDIFGRTVKVLVNEFKDNGRYTVYFNSYGLSTGIYFYRLRSNNSMLTRKMVLVR